MLRPRLLLASLALPLCLGALACDRQPQPELRPIKQDAAEPAKPDTAEPPPPPALAEPPGVQADGEIVFAFDWYEGGFERALADATHDERLLVLDVGAYWCPPCHELDEKTFVDPAVGAWMREHAIPLHIDAEKGEGPDIVERYDIQAYPTILVLQGNGIEKGRLVDFIEPAALIKKLDAIAAGGNVLAELESAAEARPDDLEALYRLAHAYVLAAKKDQANELYDAILTADPKNEAGFAAKALYDRALFVTMKLDADPKAAIAALQSLQKSYPDSKEAVRAHRMIGRAYCKLDDQASAEKALRAMVATDPEDSGLAGSFGWFAFRQQCAVPAGLEIVLAAIEGDAKNADLRYLEAELRRLSEQPKEALAAIQAASELEPDSAYYKRQVRRFQNLAKAAEVGGGAGMELEAQAH